MKRTKQINRSRIMREIWMQRETSRIDVARALRLDKSTVSNNINELLELGIIRETTEGDSSPLGGRKPINIKMNKAFGCVVGIELRPDSVTAVAVDLDGEILFSHYERVSISGENLKPELLRIIDFIRQEVSRRSLMLLGVGVGMSGVIDTGSGIIRYSIPFAIESEYDFNHQIASEVEVPVFVDNDANASVWGELAFHRQLDLKDCLFLLLEFRSPRSDSDGQPADLISLGIGLVINGKVHYGQDNSAGEFRSVQKQTDSPGQFSLSIDEQMRIETDREVRVRFFHELGANVALLVNTFNLTHIILSGEFERYHDEVPAILDAEIQKNWPYTYGYEEKKEIWFSAFGEKAVSYGAAGAVLDKLFSDLELIEDISGHLDVKSQAGII